MPETRPPVTEKYNVLLMGSIGCGKTHSIRTLLETHDEIFVLATEPGIEKVLGDLPKDRVHWHYLPPAKSTWDTLLSNAKLINQLSIDALVKSKGLSKGTGYDQLVSFLEQCNDFECQRTGEKYGAVDEWGPNRAFIVDGLSGLSQMALDLVSGAKPIRSQPEWGVAQDNLMRVLRKLCNDTLCTFVLISHITKQRDEVQGGLQITVDTVGKAIAGAVLKPFDEVIFCDRSGKGKFTWSTIYSDADLKTRTLPWADDLKPTFTQLFNKGGK